MIDVVHSAHVAELLTQMVVLHEVLSRQCAATACRGIVHVMYIIVTDVMIVAVFYTVVVVI